MIKNFSIAEIRSKFIEFFKKNGHEALPSSNLVPDSDSTALFANSGMFQFKEIFTGKAVSSWPRVTTVQKCLRIGGKHNDLENVGRTARHHTFFEMLGNFSFGDYFKKDAISFAWKFLTEELEIPREKLIITIFHEDEEAKALWKEIAGIDDSKIIKIDTKDNFWEMGDSGPCGPCSEIFYDYGPNFKGGLPGSKEQDEGERYVEIWNLVFMEFERVDGKLSPLPKKSIDTGMGLERIAAVCQNVHDNYQTDLFKELIDEASRLLKINFKPEMNDEGYIAARVAADHIRGAAFLISEGVLPGNNGREYVLKRILRRAEIFLYKIAPDSSSGVLSKLSKKLIDLMGKAYPELREKSELIQRVILNEEESFLKTIKNGFCEFERIFEEKYKDSKNLIFSGEDSFRLYDTFGFPFDLTEDLARANGLVTNKDEFEKLMEKQKELAKKSWKGKMNYQKENHEFLGALKKEYVETRFEGYDSEFCQGNLIGLVSNSLEPRKKTLIFDKTVLYVESGGQASDDGFLSLDGEKIAEVFELRKQSGFIFHECSFFDDLKLSKFEEALKSRKNLVQKFETNEDNDDGLEFFMFSDEKKENLSNLKIEFDRQKRENTKKNHTSAHLLQAALKKILGPEISQKGSSVSDSRLRFDFNFSGPVPSQKLHEIEDLVNQIILKNLEVSTQVMKREEALKTGALALFDEKYSDIVRVISVECSSEGKDEGVDFSSIEFCGGTHVKKTSEIMLFKIVSEEAVASGVRRIEAVTGPEAFRFLNNSYRQMNALIKSINIKVDNFSEFVHSLVQKNKDLEFKNGELEKSILLTKLLGLSKVFEKNDIEFYFFGEDGLKTKAMRLAVSEFVGIKKNSVLFLVSNSVSEDGLKKSLNLIISMNQNLNPAGFEASKILGEIYKDLEISFKAQGGVHFASGGWNQNIEYSKILDGFIKILNKL